MSKPTVTIIGHTCIDNNTIDGIKYESWGSPAMYISKYFLTKFGITSHIVSSYGHDFTEYAKDFVFLETPSSDKTLVYENIVTNGNREQFCRNVEHSAPLKITDGIAHLLQKTDILIVAPMLPNYPPEYIEEIMHYISKDALKVLLPQGYMRNVNAENKIEKRHFREAESVLYYFDTIIASDEDYDNALSVAGNWAIHKKKPSIVITQAEKGATVFHDGIATHIPTTPLSFNEIKNPVGSGDIFSAQFTIGLHNKLHPHEAASQANKMTAKALLSEPLNYKHSIESQL